MVAKEKGRISFFQYSPNLLDFPRLFDDIKTPGKSKNANWNGNLLDYCTAGAL
jgi:hypothetical protein